jgi:hypothetical protein
MPEFILPPLKPRPMLPKKGHVESWLDGWMTRAVQTQTSWRYIAGRWFIYLMALWVLVIVPVFVDQMSMEKWLFCVLGFTIIIGMAQPNFRRWLAKLTLHFGRVFPYYLRPWRWVAQKVHPRLMAVKHVTPRVMFWRRMFDQSWTKDRSFGFHRLVSNWLGFLALLYATPIVTSIVLDGLYAYGTYPFGTYHDIIITQAYRNIREQNVYSVHGYRIESGEKREYYFELDPNIWFWQFYVEFQFGQIPILGRCTFETYGITLRIPRRFRILASGSLYALNPHIVNLQCQAPDIVPPEKKVEQK